jgi:hypothetical protein
MSAILNRGAADAGWVLVTPEAEPSLKPFYAHWARTNPTVAAPAAYQHPDGRTAFMGREPVAEDDWRWHISLRYGNPGLNGRVPTWDELARTAHELRPGVPFSVAIPPFSFWMSVHPDVLHLYETRDPHLVATWREQSQHTGRRP